MDSSEGEDELLPNDSEDSSESENIDAQNALVSVTPSLSEIQVRLSMAMAETLKNRCPVMSGNSVAHIGFFQFDLDESILVLSAPHYDINEWRKTGAIMHDGGTDYAKALNSSGAFGKGGKDVGWIDRGVMEAVEAVASMYNATVIEL